MAPHRRATGRRTRGGSDDDFEDERRGRGRQRSFSYSEDDRDGDGSGDDDAGTRGETRRGGNRRRGLPRDARHGRGEDDPSEDSEEGDGKSKGRRAQGVKEKPLDMVEEGLYRRRVRQAGLERRWAQFFSRRQLIPPPLTGGDHAVRLRGDPVPEPAPPFVYLLCLCVKLIVFFIVNKSLRTLRRLSFPWALCGLMWTLLECPCSLFIFFVRTPAFKAGLSRSPFCPQTELLFVGAAIKNAAP